MNSRDRCRDAEEFSAVAELLAPMLQRSASAASSARADAVPCYAAMPGAIVGELLAIAEDGNVPLVRYPGLPGYEALRARSAVDLHGAHIGRPVLLIFDRADARRPIVVGVVREAVGDAPQRAAVQLHVDADGQCMIVNATERLVLRCGKASITLTREGNVLIEGTNLLSRSSGPNRIKGGSVQIN